MDDYHFFKAFPARCYRVRLASADEIAGMKAQPGCYRDEAVHQGAFVHAGVQRDPRVMIYFGNEPLGDLDEARSAQVWREAEAMGGFKRAEQ
jgi:hypothetical protein